MKTIIKLPLYLEIETVDGLDRKLITKAVREIFQSELEDVFRNLSILDYFPSKKLKLFKSFLGVNPKFKFIFETEIFKGVGETKNSHFDLNL